MPPLLLTATSLLLTLLPAKFGHWILLASVASVIVCYPPRPAAVRMWARLLLHPESLLAAEGHADEPQLAVELADGGEIRPPLQPRRRAS